MQQSHDWLNQFPVAPAGAPQPLIPRSPPPQTADQAAIDRERLAALRRTAAREEGAPVPGDTNLTGRPYLDSLHNPSLARQAQALAEGRIPWPSGRASTDAHWQSIIAAAGQYDPSVDAATANARRQAIQQFTGNGRAAQMVGSINRLANHLSDLNRASEELAGPNLGQTGANYLAARVGQSFQPAALSTYNTALPLVADELEKIARNSNGTVSGIEHAIASLSPSQSLTERRAAIREVISLIHGAVEPLQNQYDSAFQNGTSRPPIPWITPRAQQAYSVIGGIDFSLPSAPNDAGGAPPNGSPPAGSGPQSGPGAPPAPPTVQSGPAAPGEHLDAPPRALPSPSQGFGAASSDTPPESIVTPEYVRIAGELQHAFDQGATREEMNSLAHSRGLPPFGPDLDTAIAYRNRGGRRARILPPETMTPAGTRAAQTNELVGQPGAGHLLAHGAMLGLGDEAAGVGGAVENVLASPFTGNFDPVGTYQEARDADRIRTQEARDNSGWAGTGADILGSFASVNPTAAVGAAAPTFLQRVGAGARGGAAIGTVSGFGHGSGLGGSLGGALEGAAGGATIGAALPVAADAASAAGRGVRGLYRLATGNNPDLAPRTVSQAFTNDSNTPFGVGRQMYEAHNNGVPMMPADTGDNARGMLAATARAPGPARTLTRDALTQRQEGLPDRVTAAIERDLGPSANPHEVVANLSQQASTAAAPLYQAAYARPGADAFVQRMGMLSRPSMQAALQRASRIAAEEGRDPNTMGFDVNSSGETTIGATPSWQTLDYVKRGLDDVIERYRDPTTGRLNLDTEGRAINDTQRTFLREFDEANPDYAAARAAYAGPTRGAAAFQQGLRGLNLNADDLSARINRMTPFEQDMFKLGHRRAMVDQIASRGDQADMVSTLIGTGKKREALARLYGDNENFPRFVSTLQAEQAGHQTFRQAMTGSPTAANVQNDAALPGAATAALADFATTGGLPIATGIRQAVKLGATRVSRNAQEQISSLLSENDPSRIGELARVLQTRAAALRAAQGVASQRASGYGVFGGAATGNSIRDVYGP